MSRLLRPPSSRSRNIASAAAGLLVLVTACRDRAPERAQAPRVTITVSAASSLREAVMELDSLYRMEHPDVALRANFGGSGALRQQIEQGAPADVFISASDRHMDALQRDGLVDPRTRRVLAGNELVLVIPHQSPIPVTGFESLKDSRVKAVAIGVAASVPAGEYADETLRSLGLAEVVAQKTVYGQNVRQVLAYVESANVDAGIVYRTDAAVAPKVRVVATAPTGSHRSITYPLAVVTASKHTDEARAYAAFLLGPRGREVLARRGFTTP